LSIGGIRFPANFSKKIKGDIENSQQAIKEEAATGRETVTTLT
jgi:hypothetical protein